MKKKIDLKSAVEQLNNVDTAIDLTFAELVRGFCASNLTLDVYSLKKWVEAFGDQSAWAIDPHDLEAAGEAMLMADYKASTVNRNLSLIGSAYRWAKKRRICPRGFVSPTLHLTRHKEAVREVTLTDKQVQQLFDACAGIRDRRFLVYVRLLAESGARRGEILDRVWADIDLDHNQILLEHTKTGVPRMLFFSDATKALMLRVWPKHNAGDLLVESPKIKGSPVNYRRSWAAVTAAIGLPSLRLHDLRYHRAKQLLASGVSVGVASQALGHSSLILQRRYGHLETKTTRAAITQSWGG